LPEAFQQHFRVRGRNEVVVEVDEVVVARELIQQVIDVARPPQAVGVREDLDPGVLAGVAMADGAIDRDEDADVRVVCRGAHHRVSSMNLSACQAGMQTVTSGDAMRGALRTPRGCRR
jgi:hypothetical protein